MKKIQISPIGGGVGDQPIFVDYDGNFYNTDRGPEKVIGFAATISTPAVDLSWEDAKTHPASVRGMFLATEGPKDKQHFYDLPVGEMRFVEVEVVR